MRHMHSLEFKGHWREKTSKMRPWSSGPIINNSCLPDPPKSHRKKVLSYPDKLWFWFISTREKSSENIICVASWANSERNSKCTTVASQDVCRSDLTWPDLTAWSGLLHCMSHLVKQEWVNNPGLGAVGHKLPVIGRQAGRRTCCLETAGFGLVSCPKIALFWLRISVENPPRPDQNPESRAQQRLCLVQRKV